MNSGELVDLANYAKENAGWAFALALVLRSWIQKRSARKIIITTNDNRVIHAEGFDVKDLAKILELSKSAILTDGGNADEKEKVD